ncbi:hypothetical protein HHX47_DHR4000750 [Lentinula edodes]|nr:hypothetical protein HHX47_DHR4000750 [Lentinula edodes]
MGVSSWIQVSEDIRLKFGDKMLEGIFVGYKDNRIGWRVRDINRKVHFSDQVVFNESQFGHLGGPCVQKPNASMNNLMTQPSNSLTTSPTTKPNPPNGPQPHWNMKLTERGKEWRNGIHQRDELLQERHVNNGLSPNRESQVDLDIIGCSLACQILEENVDCLEDDTDFFFAVLSNHKNFFRHQNPNPASLTFVNHRPHEEKCYYALTWMTGLMLKTGKSLVCLI